jgi:hypothetical protein
VSQVSYAVGADPRGSLPAWVVNGTSCRPPSCVPVVVHPSRRAASVVNTKQPLCIARIRDLIASNAQVVSTVRAQIEERRQLMLKDMQRCARRACLVPRVWPAVVT